MLKPERIEEVRLPHFSPDGEYLGDFTDLENLLFRIEICKANIEGYYFMNKDIKITITKDGACDSWPSYWNQYSRAIADLFLARSQKRKEEKK